VQPGSRETVCMKPAALVAELGRANRRNELEAKIEAAATELRNTVPAKIANSDAVALASYLPALGIETTADRVNKLLVLLAVLVIECGGGLALTVGMALSEGVVRSEQQDGVVGQGEQALAERPTEHLDVSTERPGGNISPVNGFQHQSARSKHPERSAHERVLSALRLKDGVLFGSQVRLGASFGWSKTRMHDVLHELQAAGRVRLSAGRQGTAVRLVL